MLGDGEVGDGVNSANIPNIPKMYGVFFDPFGSQGGSESCEETIFWDHERHEGHERDLWFELARLEAVDLRLEVLMGTSFLVMGCE